MNTKRGWDPFLKYPYTRLRDLGFPSDVQTLGKDDANALLAEVALAAIAGGTSPTAVTKQVLAGGPQDALLTPRQLRQKTSDPNHSGRSSLGKGKEPSEGG